jgi:cytochrome c553
MMRACPRKRYANRSAALRAGLLLLVFVLLACAATNAAAQGYVEETLPTCFGCHGTNGVSEQAQYPILAGQEFYYLYVQLKDYKSGLRANPTMGLIVADMEKEQMKALAQYFSEQQWPNIDHTPQAEARPAALASISAGQCVACHLGGFEGNSRVPRLAGQHPEYLRQTMLDFKTKARANSPAKGSLLGSMSAEEIAHLADYLGGM